MVKMNASPPEGVFPAVRDVEEPVFILLMLVHLGHERGWRARERTRNNISHEGEIFRAAAKKYTAVPALSTFI